MNYKATVILHIEAENDMQASQRIDRLLWDATTSDHPWFTDSTVIEIEEEISYRDDRKQNGTRLSN